MRAFALFDPFEFPLDPAGPSLFWFGFSDPTGVLLTVRNGKTCERRLCCLITIERCIQSWWSFDITGCLVEFSHDLNLDRARPGSQSEDYEYHPSTSTTTSVFPVEL